MPLNGSWLQRIMTGTAAAVCLSALLGQICAYGMNQSPTSSTSGSIRIVRESSGHVYMTNLKSRVPLDSQGNPKTGFPRAVSRKYQSPVLPAHAEQQGGSEDPERTGGASAAAGPSVTTAEATARPGPTLSPREEAVEPIIQEASRRTGLSANLLRAMVKAESDFDPTTVSSKGAKGLMQLMDITAGEMMVRDVFDPLDNILGGAGYFRKLLDRYGGIIELALAAYNAGPTNVDRHKGIPPFTETRNYIRKVKRFWRDYRTQ